MPCRAVGLLSCALLLVPAGGAAAQTEACPGLAPPAAGAAATTAPAPSVPDEPGVTYLRADTIRSPAENIIELEGDAAIRRDGQRVAADWLRYDLGTEIVEARGEVTVIQPEGAELTTDEARVDLGSRVGAAEAGHYRLRGPQQGRGDMQRIELLGESRTRLHGVRYTTCPVGRDDWFLRASRIDLDTARDVGVARHARLQFFGVPLFYLPYFRFPLSDARQSGFLAPRIGYGGDLGATLATPYYLNLAPNYDATLTPRLLTDRGVQLLGEFRYLGASLGGQVEVEYLPDDDVAGRDRAAWSLRHAQTLAPRWSFAVDARRVSDVDYLAEFGEGLSATSETHLSQTARVDYGGPAWSFSAAAIDYQTVTRGIDPTAEPYARLPQLYLAGGTATDFGRFSLESELVSFAHERDDAKPTGQRLYLAPSARWPLTRLYGFVTPEIGVRHIAYSLEDPTGTLPERPSVTAPFVSLDSGLYFEREVELGGGWFDQTLEPRLYYLYVPFRDQSDLPNFDTAEASFGFSRFFRNRRFVGNDRLGDANRLSAALTTRLIDQASGIERVRASIGRIYYFDDRRVTLDGVVAEERASDIVGEAAAYFGGGWSFTATGQWATDDDRAVQTNAYLRWHPLPDRIVNIGYRFTRDRLEQIDLSAEWPLTPRWIVRGRSLRALDDNPGADRGENIHSYLGLEYRACCWAVRFYAARSLVPAPSDSAALTEQDTRFLLELELTGLGQLGERFESPLHEAPFAAVP